MIWIGRWHTLQKLCSRRCYTAVVWLTPCKVVSCVFMLLLNCMLLCCPHPFLLLLRWLGSWSHDDYILPWTAHTLSSYYESYCSWDEAFHPPLLRNGFSSFKFNPQIHGDWDLWVRLSYTKTWLLLSWLSVKISCSETTASWGCSNPATLNYCFRQRQMYNFKKCVVKWRCCRVMTWEWFYWLWNCIASTQQFHHPF